MKINIRLIYLYLFSFVGLLVTVIGCIRMVDLGLKVYVFKGADEYTYFEAPRPVLQKGMVEEKVSTEEAKIQEEKLKKQQKEESRRQRQREFAGALSMILVGIPLYLYHWKTIQRENKS